MTQGSPCNRSGGGITPTNFTIPAPAVVTPTLNVEYMINWGITFGSPWRNVRPFSLALPPISRCRFSDAGEELQAGVRG
jgi:hypothetical protein